MILRRFARVFVCCLLMAGTVTAVRPALALDTGEFVAACENKSGLVIIAMRIAACRALLEEAPLGDPEKARADLFLGLALTWENRWNDAMDAYDAAVSLQPDNALNYSERGLAYLRSGQDTLAVNDFDKALSLDPRMIYALYGRGISELRTGQTDAGNADLQTARAAEKDIDRLFRFVTGLQP